MNTRTPRRTWMAVGLALATLVPLAACSGGSGAPAATEGGASGTDPETFTVLTANENPTLEAQLTALSEDQCAAQNEALPIEHQKVAQADVVQKVTLLASQDALPAHYIAGTAMVRPDGDLGAADLLVDFETALDEQGLWDQVLPAAASTIENVYGQMVSLPYQYNLEGIWYNKAIFADLGLEEPQTYDELLEANDAILESGLTPMAEAGAAAWPLTRLIGMYLYRTVGPEALTDIRDGNASLTDPEYVEAAQALQDLADAGYFGDGFASADAATADNDFLTGKAAMKYDGTWLLAKINDPAQNTIGVENVGFMPFPAVDGGAGSIDQWPANAGTAMAMSPKAYGPKVADWLGCIAENYGSQALGDAGVISGFKVNEEVTDLPETTQLVQEKVAEITETVLWFEALMDGKSTSLAQSNVGLLVSGQMNAQDYMSQLQASIDANG